MARSPVDAVYSGAWPLSGHAAAYDPLLGLIGDAHLVLLGEATHGTHEFYAQRAAITRRLIVERGFDAVAIEGDWPDAYRVNRYVRGLGDDRDASAALAGFRRFPTWMWRNSDVTAFVRWLHDDNARREPSRRAGIYGLDLYSLRASMAAVLRHLDRVDPAAARRARDRYACFDRHGDDSQRYGLLAGLGMSPSCEEDVIATLVELRRRAALGGPPNDAEAAFDAEQNARLVANAEAYYRSMALRDESSWNRRDQHMAETLEQLRRHLARDGRAARIVVWAHNSHVGDARATEMGERGELNLGQLVREAHGGDAVLVGFTTHEGEVMAASDWDGPHARQRVLPSRDDSHEGLLHATGRGRFLLPLRGDVALQAALRVPRLERAIGVVYRPDTERQSHYFHARLSQQFDAVVHWDVTHALEPLDAFEPEAPAEAPETYPSGI